MIDFATLQGLTIPEGVVTQIADASGRVLWRGQAVRLKVKKITSNTYASGTTYANEQFVLLNIFVKSGGKVSVPRMRSHLHFKSTPAHLQSKTYSSTLK